MDLQDLLFGTGGAGMAAGVAAFWRSVSTRRAMAAVFDPEAVERHFAENKVVTDSLKEGQKWLAERVSTLEAELTSVRAQLAFEREQRGLEAGELAMCRRQRVVDAARIAELEQLIAVRDARIVELETLVAG